MIYFRQHLRTGRGALLGWAAGLGLLTYFVVALFPTIKSQSAAMDAYMASMPPAVKAMFGGQVSIGTLVGFLNVELFSWLPLLMTIYAAIAVAGIISREIDSGTAEFLFSLPVGRGRLVLERFAAFAVHLALLHALVVAAAWAGAAGIDETFPLAASLRVSAASFLVALAVAALLLLISVFVPDYSRALFTGLGTGAGLYFASIALRAADAGSAVLPWLIFGRYDSSALLEDGAAMAGDMAVLAANAAVLAAAAALAFSRRDLRL